MNNNTTQKEKIIKKPWEFKESGELNFRKIKKAERASELIGGWLINQFDYLESP